MAALTIRQHIIEAFGRNRRHRINATDSEILWALEEWAADQRDPKVDAYLDLLFGSWTARTRHTLAKDILRHIYLTN